MFIAGWIIKTNTRSKYTQMTMCISTRPIVLSRNMVIIYTWQQLQQTKTYDKMYKFSHHSTWTRLWELLLSYVCLCKCSWNREGTCSRFCTRGENFHSAYNTLPYCCQLCLSTVTVIHEYMYCQQSSHYVILIIRTTGSTVWL